MKITRVKKEREDYDPRFCRNGGSYYQPLVTIACSDGTTVVIDDRSCGDFGGRFHATVTKGATIAEAWWGTMLEDRLWSTNIRETEFPGLRESIKSATGYNLLTVERYDELVADGWLEA